MDDATRPLLSKPIADLGLPDNIDYYLFFSFKGGRNPFTNGNDDGTVSLVSQLQSKAQEAAIKTFGFNEDHMSILLSQDVNSEEVSRNRNATRGTKLSLA